MHGVLPGILRLDFSNALHMRDRAQAEGDCDGQQADLHAERQAMGRRFTGLIQVTSMSLQQQWQKQQLQQQQLVGHAATCLLQLFRCAVAECGPEARPHHGQPRGLGQLRAVVVRVHLQNNRRMALWHFVWRAR